MGEQKMKKILRYKKEILGFLSFTLLIGLFYGDTLKNGFIHDDIGQVVENEYIQSLRYLSKVVTGCIWEDALGGCKGRTTYYRPIHNLSYILTYQISSGPFIFHLVNLLYFLIAVLSVFLLSQTITKNFTFSFISALLFLVHPINNEVVNWIAAVPELAFVIFISLATVFYIRYRETDSEKKLYFVYLFYFLGMLSKEPAMLLPVVFLFIDWSFFEMEIEELLSLKELKKYFILGGVFLIYFAMRAAVIGGLGKGGSYYGEFTILERINAFFDLFGRYISATFYPYPLGFFHPFQKSSNFLSYEFLFHFILVLLFGLLFYFLIKRREKLITFSLVWFFIFLSPVLIFVNAVGENVFSERYLFASSIGFVFILSFLFTRFWEKKRKILKVFLAILIFLITGTSWYVINSRNKVWKDNEGMYVLTLSQNSNANSIRYNLTYLYREWGRTEEAKRQWEIMEEEHAGWVDINRVYNHLGSYYREKGDFNKAIEYYQKAVDTADRNGNYRGYNNLGSVYLEQGEYFRPLIHFCQALQMDPQGKESNANFNLMVSMIESLDENEWSEFYVDFINSGVFKKSEEKKMEYKEYQCFNGRCGYAFLPRVKEIETMLPFLIMGYTSSGEGIKIENYFFDQRTEQIILEIDSKYREEAPAFIFPTCEGIYYEDTAILSE